MGNIRENLQWKNEKKLRELTSNKDARLIVWKTIDRAYQLVD